jgi:hypothetical protein
MKIQTMITEQDARMGPLVVSMMKNFLLVKNSHVPKTLPGKGKLRLEDIIELFERLKTDKNCQW